MKKFYSLISISILLTSCGNIDSSTLITSDISGETKENNCVKLDYSNETYYSFSKHSKEKKYYLNSVGEQSLLVVPIIIKGYEENATEDNLDKINKAFFGTSLDTGFESVSSYYYKSSSGRLSLSGEVLDWLDLSISKEDIIKNATSQGDYGTFFVASKAYEKLYNDGFNFSKYDKDNDGFIDAIYFIYSAPNMISSDENDDENPFWAFTYMDYPNLKIDSDTPLIGMYSWSSYDFINRGKEANINIDAHTYIHEFGHLLGLVDYYDYDEIHSPLGCFDMEDFNVGDHNSYSKYALGWNKPYLIYGDTNIILKDGESIILKYQNYDNINAFDEYLMLEFLIPNNLWKQDSTNPYVNINSLTYTVPGIRMLHIDSRIRNGNEVVNEFNNYNNLEIMCSNTPSRSYINVKSNSAKYDLISLIPANKNKSLQTSYPVLASNNSLFKKGQVFTSGDYDFFFFNGRLHNFEEIPYKIIFNEINELEANIDIKFI